MKTIYVIADRSSDQYVGEGYSSNGLTPHLASATTFDSLEEAENEAKKLGDWAVALEETINDLKVTRISKQFAGYGHNTITVRVTGTLIDYEGTREVEDLELKCTSTKTQATDAFFDDQYDQDLDNIDSFYDCRYEAAESLIDEVFSKNSVESSYEIDLEDGELLTPEEVKELRESLMEE